jgi:hypothetical protein
MTDSMEVAEYDPPRIEERAPIGLPLIGTGSTITLPP